jgi:DNA-binding NarL/FixJ family response regulator
MTAWHPTTPAWYLETAERVCTPKQLEVLQLASHELTNQQIADRLGITRQAVQQRYNASIQKISILVMKGETAA